MKKIWLLVIALIVSTVLAACGGGNTKQDSTEGTAEEKDKSLVVYSNSVSDGRGDWLKEKAAEAGFDIEIVEAGGGEIIKSFNR